MTHALDSPDGLVSDLDGMLKVASSFYKDLFKKEDRKGFRLSDSFFSLEEKVDQADNDALQAPFSEKEVKEAVFGSYSDGAPGPDGLPFLFLQHF